MSLILAEGFEFFHETAAQLQGPDGGHFGPKFASWDGLMNPPSWAPNYVTSGVGPSSSLSIERHDVRRGEVSDTVDVGRKGGKSLSIETQEGEADWDSPQYPYAGLGFKVKKSRALYLGFALRMPTCEKKPIIVVTFGRSKQREPLQDDLEGHDMNVLGGCVWQERGGYADVSWNFTDNSDVYYEQVSHGQNPESDNDWHYYEFATTVLGNDVDLERCTAFAEARLSRVGARSANIRTANVGEDNETFIDCVSIRIIHPATGDGSQIRAVFDDLYICNEEGEVNNGFLGTVYIRPTRPTFTAMLSDAYPVRDVHRHTAVGPRFVGDPAEMPDPPPPPEEDPWFEEWDSPEHAYLVMPRVGNRQNFRFDDVPFTGAEPKVYGITMDVLADIPHLNLARSALTPIKTTEGKSHSYFPYSADMLRHQTGIHHLVMENPTAGEPGHLQDELWRPNMVNQSDYGFRVDQIQDETQFNKNWNPSLLRFPRTHDHTVEEVWEFEDAVFRFWDKVIEDGFDIADVSDRFWACPVSDGFGISDVSERIRRTYFWQLDWVYIRDQFFYIERFIRDSAHFEETTNVDTGFTEEDGFLAYDLAYHEIVEQLKVWLDPTDEAWTTWGHVLADGFMLEVSDIWDGHFEITDKFRSEDYAESNQLLVKEYFGFDEEATAGWGAFADDGFTLEENHHDGWWVQETGDPVDFSEEILTRVFRFYFFFGICINWWHIGPWEQPLESWEPDPCEGRSKYQEVMGYDEMWDDVYADLRSQWIELGGDPAVFDAVEQGEMDLGDYDHIKLNSQGEAVDIVDEDGNSLLDTSDLK